jgi:hypothetical protein
VPSSGTELSPRAQTLPFPYVAVANITLVLPVVEEPVVNTSPCTEGLLVLFSVMVAPLENFICVGVPFGPDKIIGLVLTSAKLDVDGDTLFRSILIPKGLLTTPLFVKKSFQIAGESQPSLFLSLIL